MCLLLGLMFDFGFCLLIYCGSVCTCCVVVHLDCWCCFAGWCFVWFMCVCLIVIVGFSWL